MPKTISKGRTRMEEIPEAEKSSGFNTDVQSTRANKVRVYKKICPDAVEIHPG